MSVKHRSMWYVLYSKLYRKLATASDNKSIRCSSAGYCWSCMLKAFCLWIQFISPFPPWFLSVCGTQRKSFILYNIHIHIHIHIHVLHNFSTVQVFRLAFYSREHIIRANWQESAQYYILQKNLNKVSKSLNVYRGMKMAMKSDKCFQKIALKK